MWNRFVFFLTHWWQVRRRLNLRVWLRWVATGSIGCAMLALANCAAVPQPAPTETRYLTPEQDREIGEACEAGCAIIPRDEYFEMLRRQQQMGV